MTVNETLSDLGLERTRVLGGTADVHRSLVADTAAADTAAAFRVLTSNDAAPAGRAHDTVLASATTAREMTRLLAPPDLRGHVRCPTRPAGDRGARHRAR
jgi:beta-lactamase class A